MTKFNYTKGSGNQNAELTEGDYNVIITKADIVVGQGEEKLVVDFTLENEEVRTEWIKLESWIPLFTDLLAATGMEFSEEGEFDTDNFVGLEGVLKIVKRDGKGKHEGKTFYNADRFLVEKKSE